MLTEPVQATWGLSLHLRGSWCGTVLGLISILHSISVDHGLYFIVEWKL